MSKHSTKLAGVTFEGRQDNLKLARLGDSITLERGPDNEYDPNAVRVMQGKLELGWVPKALAADIAPRMDAGEIITEARIIDLTGGVPGYPTRGCDIGFSLGPSDGGVKGEAT